MKKNFGKKQIRMSYQNQKDRNKRKLMKKIKEKSRKKKSYCIKVKWKLLNLVKRNNL